MIKNSNFAITITGTKELNLGEGATADDYGKNITYVFALEAGTEYSIKVNAVNTIQ